MPAPRILPGRLHKDNKGSVDWGTQNLIAYGCHSYIVVVDPASMNVVQTLDEHIAPVCIVRWANEAIRQESSPHTLKLASGDISGNIIVWNVHEGSVMATMTDKPLIDLKWHPEDSTLIVGLHAPNSLVMWNVANGTKIWKKEVSDHSLSTFIFDPFESSSVTVASAQGFIYGIQDFKFSAAPAQVDFKYKINSRVPKQATGKQPANIDFVQMTYSPHSRSVVYIMLSREILIFDTTTNQSLGSVVLERSKANFSQMCLYKESPDLLLCLHEDGAISAWMKKKVDLISSHNYENVSVGDLAYLNKKSKKKATPVVGIAKAPYSDHSLAAICADGSLCTWNYVSNRLSVTGTISPITSAITSICVSPFDDNNPKVSFGTTNGTIVIADMQTRAIEREFVIGHATQAIHGVKWINPTRLVSFSCDESQEKPGTYKNTLCWLDISSGKTREFRRISAPEPTFIRGIRVSPLRQYLVLLLKDRPFELWDLRTFSLTRTFKQFTVTALEWAIRDAPPPSPGPTPHHFPPPFTKTNSSSSFSAPSLSLNIPSFSSLASTISSFTDRSQNHSINSSGVGSDLSNANFDDLDLNNSSFISNSSLKSEISGSDFSDFISNNNNSGIDDDTPPSSSFASAFINTSFNNVYFNAEEDAHSSTMPEMFVFTSQEGIVRFFSVDGTNITPNEIQVDLGPGLVSSLAWKNDMLVSGDTAGTIHCWHLDKRKLQTYATHKGLIKRIRFSPSTYSTQVLVLFAGGDFGIWDLQHGARVSISSYLYQREVKATEVDWLTESAPIITTTDGCVRVLDKSLATSNSTIPTITLGLTPDALGLTFVPLSTPHLLNDTVALHLKALLYHQSSNPAFSFEKDTAEISGSLLSLISPSFLANLRPLSVADRCLQVARFFGDTQEIDFWLLAIYFIEKLSQQQNANNNNSANTSASSTPSYATPKKQASAFFNVLPSYARYPDSPSTMSPIMSPSGSPRMQHASGLATVLLDETISSETPPASNLSSLSSSPATILNKRMEDYGDEDPNATFFSPNASCSENEERRDIPLYFDLLLPGEKIKDLQTERANIHGSKPSPDANLSKTLVEKNIMIGRSEKAVSLLLDTQAESGEYMTHALKACVVAATMGPDALARTVKVVATGMIASNRVDEGVQLLCLIGKGLDACRYLQSYDRWEDAALLAKTHLSESECSVVMRKWAQYLISSNQKVKAIHVLLSLGEFQIVLQVLRDQHRPDSASLFASACLEKNLLFISPSSSSSSSTSQEAQPTAQEQKEQEERGREIARELLRSSARLSSSELSSSQGISDPSSLRALLENVHFEYATMLQQVGCTAGALHYLAKSGKINKTSPNK